MRSLLTPSGLGQDDGAHRDRIFRTVVRVTMAIAISFLLAITIVQPPMGRRALFGAAFIAGLGLVSLWLSRRGGTVVASWLVVGGLIALVTGMAWSAGGIYSPGTTAYFIFVLMAGLLLGEAAAMIVAATAALLGFGLVIAEWAELLPAPFQYSTVARWLLNCLYIGVVVLLVRFASRAVREALSRAESELAERRQAQQRLDLALRAGQIGVWDQDLKTGDFRGDERAFVLFGLPLTGNRVVPPNVWRGMVHAADRDAVTTMLGDCAGGVDRAWAEYRIVRPDGAEREVQMAGSAVFDEHGEPIRIVGMMMDVTERKTADRDRERLVLDLRERVKELQLLHRVARLLRDRSFDYTVLAELVELMPPAWLYPECCEARIRYADLEATTVGWRETPFRQSASFATSAGDGVVEVVYLEERPPAGEGPFLMEERALIDSLAEMLGAYLERYQTERRRLGLESQLRQSQKMEALGTLAGGIAHDFNNILSAIGGNAELALADAKGGTSQVQTSLEEINKACGRAKDLVKRILLFSRQQDSKRKVIPLAPVIEEAVQLLRASLPPMIQIRTSYSADLPLVLADPTQIHQILMNLGTNAGYAMSERGGVLSVEADRVIVAEGSIVPSADLRAGAYLRLTVSDTGSGMPRQILDRLFEPFFTTKGLAGTGLGLSVVHGIIRDHEAGIMVESEVGRGTVFQLYFPAAVAAAEQAGLDPLGVVRGRGQHIMYVDDDEALVFMMSRALRRLGYRCTGFSDAAAALHAFRTTPSSFDAVVTDFAMPTLTGVELAKALVGIRPDLPVALASGYGADDAGSVVGPGIVARITKPATLEELSQALDGMLRRAA